MARPMAMSSEFSERAISSSWPLRRAITPPGRARDLSSPRISAATAPMSRPDRLPEITAVRFWPIRRISVGPSATRTLATDFRKMGTPARWPTIIWLTSSTEACPSSTERTRMSISRSAWVKRVATSPWTLLRMVDATEATSRSSRTS